MVQSIDGLLIANFYGIRNTSQGVILARVEDLNPLEPTGLYCCSIPSSRGDMTFCANLGRFTLQTILKVKFCKDLDTHRP